MHVRLFVLPRNFLARWGQTHTHTQHTRIGSAFQRETDWSRGHGESAAARSPRLSCVATHEARPRLSRLHQFALNLPETNSFHGAETHSAFQPPGSPPMRSRCLFTLPPSQPFLFSGVYFSLLIFYICPFSSSPHVVLCAYLHSNPRTAFKNRAKENERQTLGQIKASGRSYLSHMALFHFISSVVGNSEE